jgi:hypothetical protein
LGKGRLIDRKEANLAHKEGLVQGKNIAPVLFEGME